MPVPPKPVNPKACRGIGISFSPEDLDWFAATYGKMSATDWVRSAMHEAKCWRHHLAELDAKLAVQINADHEPHDAPVSADKVATERIEAQQ
jgi:hypothetical protein